VIKVLIYLRKAADAACAALPSGRR
jgi:hypothetical protein